MRELEASPDPTSWYEGKCLIAITGQYPVMEGLNPLCSQQYNAPGSSESIAEKAIMKYSAPRRASLRTELAVDLRDKFPCSILYPLYLRDFARLRLVLRNS